MRSLQVSSSYAADDTADATVESTTAAPAAATTASGSTSTFVLDTASNFEADQVLEIMSHLEAGDQSTIDEFNSMIAEETGGDGSAISGATVSCCVQCVLFLPLPLSHRSLLIFSLPLSLCSA
jgi:hypothetical protein